MPAPRYRALVDAYTDAIREGRLPAGTRLPTHRELAAREGMAVVTATRVYAELEAAGLVSGEQGRGTFVRDLALPPGHGVDQDAVAKDAVDLNFNYPTLPEQADLLRQALRDIASSGDIEALLRYQPHAGRPADRAAIGAYLQRRGVRADLERILIVNGAQHGLSITLMATLKPGDAIAVDALTYPGLKVLAHALHLDLVPVPITTAGTDLDALAELSSSRPIRAVYMMPTLHNPLGTVMDETDRERLIAIARRHGQLIIEDASYAYLVERPPSALTTLAPDLTVHVSGFSKSVATGLRVGYLLAPNDLVPRLGRMIRATTWNSPALTVAIATRWLDDGTIDGLEARKRADAQRRQAIAQQVLQDLRPMSHPSSYFTWLSLPPDARADRIAGTLAQGSISVATAEPFATTAHVPQAIRLALGSAELLTLADTLTKVRNAIQLDAAS